MQEINKYYRNINQTTDVIAFALNDCCDNSGCYETELGDIFINVDAAIRQAEEYNHSERREICFLFTHGLLHLCGFNHLNRKDEKEMIYYQNLILDNIVSKDDK
jgi:probable rRNA maturation factor